jgi:hypothetical protein
MPSVFIRAKQANIVWHAAMHSRSQLWVKTRPPLQDLHVRSRQVQTFAASAVAVGRTRALV